MDEKELLDPVLDIDLLSDDRDQNEDIEPSVDVPELFEEAKEVQKREEELRQKEEGIWRLPTMEDYIEGSQKTNCRKCLGRGFTGYRLMSYGTKVKKISKKAKRKGKQEKSIPAYMIVKIPCNCMKKNENSDIWKKIIH